MLDLSLSGIEARFWPKVEKTDGCWLWSGATGRFGHGLIRIGPAGAGMIGTHRLSWIIANGPIPDGLHVLHRCDVPACVRPDHLFVGTPGDNVRDAASKGRLVSANAQKKVCPQGHPYDDENTYLWSGGRACRTCRTEARARYKERVRV